MEDFKKVEALAAALDDTSVGRHLTRVIALAKAFCETAPFKRGERIILSHDCPQFPDYARFLKRGCKGVVRDIEWRGHDRGWELAVTMEGMDQNHMLGGISAIIARPFNAR